MLQGIRKMAEDNNGGWIKPALSGLLGATLGMLITYSTGVASNRTEIVRLSTKVDNLTNTIESNMSDRYRGADAARDLTPIREKIAEIIIHDAEQEAELRDHLRNHEKVR